MAQQKISKLSDVEKHVSSAFLSKLNPEDLNRKLNEAWLGVLTNEETLANPLLTIPVIAQDNFSEYLVWLMSQPEYFYFLLKVVLQLDSFPAQCLVLKELYNHRFPILLASRGWSKCCCPQTLIITKSSGVKRIKELVPNDDEGAFQSCNESLLGENKYTKVKYSFYNGEKATKKIFTRSGRHIEATLDHPIRVVSNGKIVWKNSEDIKVGDYLPVVRGVEQWDHNDLHHDVAYMIGAMVGDGCYSKTATSLKFTNQDSECLFKTNYGLNKWNNINLKQVKLKSGKTFEYFSSGGIIAKNKFIKDFGCAPYSKVVCKITPKIIFSTSFKSISAYIMGLFDTDGCCPTNSPVVELSTKSIQLAEETQFLLMCLGINSHLRTQYNKKYNKDYYKLVISGSSLKVFREKIGFGISRKQKMLDKHCLKITNDNIDLLPKELILDKMLALRELARDETFFEKSDPYSHSVMSPNRLKSYSLSYTTAKAILNTLSKSESVKNSYEYRAMLDIIDQNYYYDKVTKIEDGFCKTYDVELVDDHSFISNGFISHNTFTLSVYIILKMLINPGIKCVITGAGFRQAKIVFEYMEQIWKKSMMLQNCFRGGKNGPFHGTDVWTFRIGDSITYALPVGPDGSKIRGYRANLLSVEEFSSVNRQVFEEVMSGFLAVAASPIEQIKHKAKISAMKKLYIPISLDQEDNGIIQNQLILSGTAYYKFNHFYQYFKKWREIVYSCGDTDRLKEILGEDNSLENFNWKNYSVARIPIELIQEGFMDMDQINRTKASASKDVFFREFSCVFSDDSDGFFKRSLIDHCTVDADDIDPIKKNGEVIKFGPALYGDKSKKYIYGVDPAYQGDNFAIVVLEINEGHRRIVHSWTTQASDHKQLLKDGVINENNYYYFCVRKMRTLMKRFPCAGIALDSQGGGRAIVEALMDDTKLEDGEVVILPVIDTDEKPKETDLMEGDHILHIINFTSDWISEANHSLKKDMESRDILFPYHDAISYALSEYYDEDMGDNSSLYDTLDDCIYDIEELKKELSTITISETSTGREKFDTPDVKTGIQKKGRLKKDRYSALLMANWVARTTDVYSARPIGPDILTLSGFSQMHEGAAMFRGNSKIAAALNDLYK